MLHSRRVPSSIPQPETLISESLSLNMLWGLYELLPEVFQEHSRKTPRACQDHSGPLPSHAERPKTVEQRGQILHLRRMRTEPQEYHWEDRMCKSPLRGCFERQESASLPRSREFLQFSSKPHEPAAVSSSELVCSSAHSSEHGSQGKHCRSSEQCSHTKQSFCNTARALKPLLTSRRFCTRNLSIPINPLEGP